MKLYICSLLILAVLDGFNCASLPQEQYGIRGHEVRLNLNPKLKLALAVGKRNEDGLYVIQPEINPSFDGSAGYYKSFLPPPGYYAYSQYPNYPQIPIYPPNQPPQQYPIYQQMPNVPQNQPPQQYPIYQQMPNVPQNQPPQQYSNNQPNTFVPQNQAPVQFSNNQNPEMAQYQPYQYQQQQEPTRQDKIVNTSQNVKA